MPIGDGSLMAKEDGHLLLNFTANAPVTFGNNIFADCPSGPSSAVVSFYHNPEYTSPYVGIPKYDGPDPEVRLWPNPTNNLLYVEKDNTPIDYITIIDIYGRTLIRETVKSNSTWLNVSQLPVGTYLLETVSKDRVSTGKFVKSNY